MRMSEKQVKQVCLKILETLRNKKLIVFKKSETEVAHKMEEIFIRDLRVEDEINQEAEKILQQYALKMGASIDRERMLQLIKKQLIKDKNAII